MIFFSIFFYSNSGPNCSAILPGLKYVLILSIYSISLVADIALFWNRHFKMDRIAYLLELNVQSDRWYEYIQWSGPMQLVVMIGCVIVQNVKFRFSPYKWFLVQHFFYYFCCSNDKILWYTLILNFYAQITSGS